jgi:hypothetical protein
VRKADNITTILCRCHEIWNLNFLEPSGPLQACNGTALPLLLLKDDVSMRFEASTILMLRIRVFWYITSFQMENMYQRF